MASSVDGALVTSAPGVRRGYRPALDGVRGVAVLLVLVDHIGHEPQWHVGPYGVTLFFALSGYLITGLLFDELVRERSVSLTRFYLRRAARLLPALLLVVLVCDLAFLLLGDTTAVKASIPALAYVANYATILDGEYLWGWGHTWSLAIEEHFYAIWPLVLILMLRRLGARRALMWTLVACGVALAWRTVLLTFDGYPGQWFAINHGTVARADALLYGCAAALALRLGWRPRAWMAWAAPAVIVAVFALRLPDGVEATLGQVLISVACALTLASLDHNPTPLARGLSVRPLVLLGVISYGVYLWHYPLLFVAYDLGFEGPVARLLSGGVLGIALAAASYVWLEQPVRRRVRAREDLVVGWREWWRVRRS